MRRHTLLFLFALSFTAFATAAEEETSSRSSSNGVIKEMNLARQNPQLYAAYVEEVRATFNGAAIVLPGGTTIHIKEGTRALDEAVGFLRHAQALPPLTSSAGMSRAAADHCADQAGGGFGHAGTDRSNPMNRISRYGKWSGGWAENISYGKSSARDVVLALIIDDGQPARKHRKNIFNPIYNYAGAAFGRHAKFGSMCNIDFAGGYAERGRVSDEPLVARNF
jgi:uncharacterized protein YkwD